MLRKIKSSLLVVDGTSPPPPHSVRKIKSFNNVIHLPVK
jgi:hypothetical protein